MHLILGHHQWVEDKETKLRLKAVKESVQTALMPGQKPGGSMDDNIGTGCKLIIIKNKLS